MSGLWTICRRELVGLFLGPLAWVLLCVALLFNGFFFVLYLAASDGDVGATLELVLGRYWLFWALMLLVPPLLTMRMISEEARSGVLEFILTAPVSDFAVVAGKWLAATIFMALSLAVAPAYGLLIAYLGASPDWGSLMVGFAGALLLAAFFCALGLVASALTPVPLLSAFLAVVSNIALLALPFVGDFVGAAPDGEVRRWLAHFDVIEHYRGSFLRGVLDSAHVVFFVAWTAFFLFLATRLLEARRWR